MRILMLSKALLVGAYQSKLAAIARHADVNLLAVVPPTWNDPAGQVTLEPMPANGYRLLVEPLRFNGNFHLHYYPGLPRRLAEFRPDIVHIDEEPYNLATWLAWRQAKAVGAKTLFFSWQNLRRAYPPPFRWWEKQVLAGVDYALMGNAEAMQVWRAKGYRGPAQIIPQFGVDPAQFAPPPQRNRAHGFVFGSANRRLVAEKGDDLLLRAAARLPGDWRLHIAGDGPFRPTLERLAAALGIGDRVQFDGPIPSGQMAAYLGQLDALVLASRTLPNWKEQFGRVLVEAMACETAVIGAISGEIPHVIGDAGLTFPEDDADALHGHLLRLMESEMLRDELGRNGRRRVLAHYTQAQIADQTVAVYRDIVEKAGYTTPHE
jgi:glycosyltransferase involved in cell wall biosynthesis